MPSIVRDWPIWVNIWANLVEIIEEVFCMGVICVKFGRTMTLLKTDSLESSAYTPGDREPVCVGE